MSHFGDEWFGGDDDSYDGGGGGVGFSDYEFEEDEFGGGGQMGVEQLARMGKVAAANQIFSTDRVDGWKRGIRGRERSIGAITNMTVANKVVIMSTNAGHVLRWTAGHDVEAMLVTRKPDERIHKVFIDPRGNHVLFTVVSASKENPQTYYLHVQSSEPEKVNKVIRANAVLDAVAWDKRSPKDMPPAEYTGSVLVGSSDGTIYETLFERKRNGVMHCKYFTPLMKLRLKVPKAGVVPKALSICGLEWERFPAAPGEPDRYFVMAAAAVPPGAVKASDEASVRYYQFVGGPTFEVLFDEVPAEPPFASLPNQTQFSQLVFHHKHRGGGATSFALLTGAGIFRGQLRYSSQSQGDSVIAETGLVMLPDRTASASKAGAGGAGAGSTLVSPASAPVGMSMTQYHFLLLYPDSVVAISRVSEEVVWEEHFDAKIGMMLGIVTDPANRTLWMATDKHLYQILKKEEDRDVWRLYLEQAFAPGARDASNRFETALVHSKTAEQREKVLTAQADYLFSHGERDLAATKYARTSRSFEEVALKFINAEDRGALKTFLRLKLESLPTTASTQRTILCTWLTEIFLDEMNSLQDLDDNLDLQTELASSLQSEFKSFLTENLTWLNEATTFHLISSHGRIPQLLLYAGLVKDYERVLTHYMQQGQWETALETLRDAPDDQAEELYYKLSPQLILNAPAATVKAWKRARFLDATKLIPALVRYSQHQASLPSAARDSPNQAIIYLDYQVVSCRNKDAAIHNYLLSLFAKQEDDTDLLNFILRQTMGRKRPVFDLRYALRVCTLEGRDRACVHIYSAMGLYEEAVELALSKVGVDLAKENASMPEDDEELQKKLWLRIAHHVIEKERNVEMAIKLVKESELLKIEDVLKFFPDFVVIDEFKAEITASLDECSTRIADLKDEMKEYTESADRIRDDIKALRNRYGYVQATQKCELCEEAVLSGSFYLFPCMHAFHNTCLIRQVSKHLTRSQLDHVRDLQRNIMLMDAAAQTAKGAQRQRAAGKAGEGQGAVSKRDALQAELDDYVAAECLFCGDIMINSIVEPFDVDADGPLSGDGWDI